MFSGLKYLKNKGLLFFKESSYNFRQQLPISSTLTLSSKNTPFTNTHKRTMFHNGFLDMDKPKQTTTAPVSEEKKCSIHKYLSNDEELKGLQAFSELFSSEPEKAEKQANSNSQQEQQSSIEKTADTGVIYYDPTLRY